MDEVDIPRVEEGEEMDDSDLKEFVESNIANTVCEDHEGSHRDLDGSNDWYVRQNWDYNL